VIDFPSVISTTNITHSAATELSLRHTKAHKSTNKQKAKHRSSSPKMGGALFPIPLLNRKTEGVTA
jgi:hypothetical protein